MTKAFLLGTAFLALGAASPAGAVPADFQAKADAILKSAFPADQPGAAVIVTDDGKTIYAAGQGLADLEAKAPVTPATVFRIGSITKQFSAAVMLQLVAEGKVSLDDPLSKFFPDFPKPGADATVAQLLNHTVGVQSYTNVPGWMANESNTARLYTTDEMIALFKDMPAPSKPGEKFQYNNSGYVLVGAVIEKVTGKPWHVNIEERIARPLGLTTIRYGVAEDHMPNMAKGYTETGDKQVPARKIHMSVPHAAGALIGSVEDLAKWSHALHHGKVIPPELYGKMITPTSLPDGKTEDYGFGLAQDDVRGRKAIRHGGGIFGFSTEAVYIPDQDLFVAVFTNSDDPPASEEVLAYRIAALALGDPYPAFQKADVDAKALEPYFGVYALDGGERRFFAKEGKLYTRRSGAGDLEVFAAGGNRFFYGSDSLTWFEIKSDAAGQPTIAMYQNGSSKPELSVLKGPIPPEPKTVDLPRATIERYAGSYKAAPGILKVAAPEDGPMTLQLGGQRPVPIKPVSELEFLAEGVDAKVIFEMDGPKVKGLVLHQGGRQLPAERLAD
jgi:D-alanyl-D-alanine carboxypeptidase